jgi:hypothetical protein
MLDGGQVLSLPDNSFLGSTAPFAATSTGNDY